MTTEKIKEQNLDFNVGNSNIEEIGIVIKGIDKMKKLFKEYLRKLIFFCLKNVLKRFLLCF